jgi:MFS family permease
MIWGLLPIVLLSMNYDSQNIGIIAAIYPNVWGFGQLFTGRMSDIYSKKKMLFGNVTAGYAILFIPFAQEFYQLASISAVLGTALVYPTFICHCTGDNSSSKSRKHRYV